MYMHVFARQTVLTMLLAGLGTAPGFAQQPAQPVTTPNYWLRTTANLVNVRSRADLNSRVVARVPLNTVLRGVAEEGDWHRILPPDGVFSLVSAAYIDRQSQTHGVVRVNVGTLRVRVGSTVVDVDPLKEEVQTRLTRGTPVDIVGEQSDGWLRIKPPAGVYYYISKTYTERITEDEARRLMASPTATPAGAPARRGDEQWTPVPRKPPAAAQQPADNAATTTREPIVATAIEPAKTTAPAQTTPAAQTSPVAAKPPAKLSPPAGTNTADDQEWKPVPRAAEASTARTSPAATTAAEPAKPAQAIAHNTPPVHQPAQPKDTGHTQTIETPAATANPPPPAARVADTTIVRTPTRATTPRGRPHGAAPAHSSTGVITASSPPATATAQPPTASTAPGVLPPFMATGILRPSFRLPIAPTGLRYELVHPYTHKVVAYAEFGADVNINPTRIVGRYVGISGRYVDDPQLPMRVIRVTHITVLDMPTLQRSPARPRRP